jgi:glycine/D-amino acid oxidase-like deaminating enzyme
MRAAVIGCGLIGAAVARELQLRGVETTIFEAREPGAGTSGTTFAWVNSFNNEPRAYHDLNVAGMEAHAALRGEGGGSQWFFPTGNLVWPAADGQLDRLSEWDYPARRLTVREACTLEPDIQIPDDAEPVLFPAEGHVLPALLLARLLDEALDCGAQLRCPASVTALHERAAGVELTLDDGSIYAADLAVSCAGRWTQELVSSAGHFLPMADATAVGSETVGYLAYTQPSSVRLGRVLTTPRLNVRPDGGERLVLQALDLDHSADPAQPVSADGPLAAEFVRRLGDVLRGGDRAEIEAIRVGQRAMPADGITIAGRLDGGGRIYVVATHSGVTLALLLGRLAAEEVVRDGEADLLAPFRPQRFAPAHENA